MPIFTTADSGRGGCFASLFMIFAAAVVVEERCSTFSVSMFVVPALKDKFAPSSVTIFLAPVVRDGY